MASAAIAAGCRSKAPVEDKARVVQPAIVGSPAPGPVATGWPIPVGPRLAVLAGEGIGPIRFGATVETIERHMGAPCEIRTEVACRYIGRAIELFLEAGVVKEIRLHRSDRQASPAPRVYGVFNGRTPEGVAFFMLPNAVIELIGKPRRIEPVTAGGAWNTVETHDYPGMRLEYDRISNGNVVLGGVILTKAPPPSSK
jgi:hypothetical protein